jgi:hypothetical protein
VGGGCNPVVINVGLYAACLLSLYVLNPFGCIPRRLRRKSRPMISDYVKKQGQDYQKLHENH